MSITGGTMNTIKLADIDTTAGTQIRHAMNQDTVSDYADAMTEGEKFPPIIVFADGSHYWLADGFHRVAAAARLEFRDIEAEVRKGTRADAIWFGLGANRTNGIRLSRADVRHAIAVALKEFSGRSNREIAKQIGCDDKTVAAERTVQEAGAEIPHHDRRVGKDGVAQPAHKASKPYVAPEVSEQPEVSVESNHDAHDGGEHPAKETSDDHCQQLRSIWKLCGKADRESFLAWTDSRGCDLPKGKYRDAFLLCKKLNRILDNKSEVGVRQTVVNEIFRALKKYSDLPLADIPPKARATP